MRKVIPRFLAIITSVLLKETMNVLFQMQLLEDCRIKLRFFHYPKVTLLEPD